MNKSYRYCSRILHLFLALFLLAVNAIAAHATTLMRMPFSLIIRARCIANISVWDSGEIWTRTTFEVEESWNGAPVSERISVRLLGGTLANITSRVSGIPRFHPGEEAVLFLEPATRGDFSIVSWQQGTFRIARNRQTGENIVTQGTAFFAAYDPASRRFEAAGIRGILLSDLHSRVDGALAADPWRKP